MIEPEAHIVMLVTQDHFYSINATQDLDRLISRLVKLDHAIPHSQNEEKMTIVIIMLALSHTSASQSSAHKL